MMKHTILWSKLTTEQYTFLQYVIKYRHTYLSIDAVRGVKTTIENSGYFTNSKRQTTLNTIRDWHLDKYVEYVHRKNKQM